MTRDKENSPRFLTRRDRLSNIILGLSPSWPHEPHLAIKAGNSLDLRIFDDGRPTLDLLAEEALEAIAVRMVRHRAGSRRFAERNRSGAEGRS